MNGTTLREDPRIAGQVTRYSTWPRITQQSIGEHSWQVYRILYTVWPNAPVHVFHYCIFHDIGELVAGDAPYPVKAENTDLAQAHSRIESMAIWRMCSAWGMAQPVELSAQERHIFKICEFVEMWEWGLHESLLGSAYGLIVAERCLAAAKARLDEMSGSAWDGYMYVRSNISAYITKRTREMNGV